MKQQKLLLRPHTQKIGYAPVVRTHQSRSSLEKSAFVSFSRSFLRLTE